MVRCGRRVPPPLQCPDIDPLPMLLMLVTSIRKLYRSTNSGIGSGLVLYTRIIVLFLYKQVLRPLNNIRLDHRPCKQSYICIK